MATKIKKQTFGVGGTRPNRGMKIDLGFGGKSAPKSSRRSSAEGKKSEGEKEEVGWKSVYLQKMPIGLYNLVLDQVFTERTRGEILSTPTSVIEQALKCHFKAHPPSESMPLDIREKFGRRKRR